MRHYNFRLGIVGLISILTLGACDDKYGDDLRGIGARVEVLEKKALEANSDISTLKTILEQIETEGYITKIIENTDGTHTITFNDGRVVTLRNGKVGRNGTDGTDGAEADLIIGVEKGDDGAWYWKLNGEWILTDDGQKMRASATDGKDGKDGLDGKDGVDGKDGKDGRDGRDGLNGVDGKDGHDGHDGKEGKDDINLSLPIPRIQINDDGIWEISTDNGKTWTPTGVPANGKDGKDGENGKDGRVDIFLNATLSDDGKGLVINLKDGRGPYILPIIQE